MSRKYTPGPWTIVTDGSHWIRQPGISGLSVAVLIGREEMNANARLIAAAPDMHKLLKSALLHVLNDGNAELTEAIMIILNSVEGVDL